MNMFVILDTNSARELVAKKTFDEINEYSKILAKKLDSKKLKLLISPLVLLELLYHVDNIKNRDFSISKKTIKCLMLVSKNQIITPENTFLATPEILLANDLYNLKIESRERMYFSIFSCCEQISNNPFDFIPDLTSTDGDKIVDYINFIEKSFVDQIKEIVKHAKYIIETQNSTLQDFLNSRILETMLVNYIARTTYNLLHSEGKLKDFNAILKMGLRNNECIELMSELDKNKKIIVNRYPYFLLLFKELIKRIYESKMDIKDEKIKNFIWDILLMFNVSNNKFKGESVVFVTNDKAMLKSVSDKGVQIWNFIDFYSKIF